MRYLMCAVLALLVVGCGKPTAKPDTASGDAEFRRRLAEIESKHQSDMAKLQAKREITTAEEFGYVLAGWSISAGTPSDKYFDLDQTAKNAGLQFDPPAQSFNTLAARLGAVNGFDEALREKFKGKEEALNAYDLGKKLGALRVLSVRNIGGKLKTGPLSADYKAHLTTAFGDLTDCVAKVKPQPMTPDFIGKIDATIAAAKTFDDLDRVVSAVVGAQIAVALDLSGMGKKK
jgi:hypothetical protein